jgi:hypothetical protein
MPELSKIEITEVVLLSIHILVSLIMIFVSKNQCNNKLIPIAWLVSLVVVIIVLSLILMS